MKDITLFILGVLILIAASNAKANNPIRIGDIYVLPDSSLFSEVRSELNASEKHVFTLRISNLGEDDFKGILTFSKLYIYAEQIQILNEQGQVYSTENVNHPSLKIPSKQSIDIKVRLKELDMNDPKGFEIQVLSIEEFEKNRDEINKSQYFVFGILIFLFAFNLILYLVTKWKVYGIYSLYIFSAFLFLSYYFGFTQSLLSNPGLISINSASILYSLIFVLYFWFILRLGNYEVSSPRAAQLLKIGVFYQSAQIILELIFYRFNIVLMQYAWYTIGFLIFELALMSMIIYHISRSPNLRGKIVIGGSSFLILGAILAQFDTGYNPMYILELGILFELLAFSVGLGYISRKYYQDKLKTEKLYIEELEKNKSMQHEMQLELEEMVKNRTKHLERTTKNLEQKNKENAILLSEVHHRVKNNLQIISSMLNMQFRQLKDPKAKTALSNALNRVNTIGLLHDQLYNRDPKTEISLKRYIQKLSDKLIKANGVEKWQLELELIEMNIGMNLALKLGIILNELFLNSIKYAKGSRIISVKVFIKNIDGALLMEIDDNGRNQNYEIKEGFGMRLIRILIGENGEVSFSKNSNGFTARIRIPNEENL